MAERPYLLVSCAMSVDGYIDDASPARLILSSEIDADRVDEVRAGCDAILVGARTVRRDDPRLLVRSPERRIRRLARGATENPVKVTITATGDLDPAARFFTGNAARLVYCARPALATLRERLAGLAEVVDAGDAPSPALLAHDLAERGMARVLLEGGGELATQFLAAGLADELHLVIAPFFVGDPAAPRFALPGRYPHGPDNRMQLAEVRQLGDVVLLRYLLGTRHPARAARAVRAAPGSAPAAGPPTTSAGSARPSTCSAPARPRLLPRPSTRQAPAARTRSRRSSRPASGGSLTWSRRSRAARHRGGGPACPARRAAPGPGSGGHRLAARGHRAVQAVPPVADRVLGRRGHRGRRRHPARDRVLPGGRSARSRRGGRAGQGAARRLPAAHGHAVQLARAVRRPCLPAVPVFAADHRRGIAPGGVRLARAAPAGCRRRRPATPRGRRHRHRGSRASPRSPPAQRPPDLLRASPGSGP